MTRDEFLDKQYEISFTAGMNQRYHQTEMNTWWRADASARIATAISAVISVALAIVSLVPNHHPAFDWIGMITALAAAIGAVVLNVFQFGDWRANSADFFRRWSDLREEADALLFELVDGDPVVRLVAELKSVEAKLQRICGSETLADDVLLKRCEAAERQCRGENSESSRPVTPCTSTGTA